MKKIIAICMILILAMSLLACGEAKSYTTGFAGEVNGEGSREGSIVDATLGRKIVYTVNIDLESKDVDGVRSAISAKNAELGGHIGSSNEKYDDGKCISVRITYRVPTDKLDQLVSSIEGQGGVKSKSINTTDITTSYVSTEARRNALAEKKALLEELLENNAISANERVSIISQISDVNAEILSLDLQIKEYDSMVDFSTVYLYISRPYDPTVTVIVICGIFAAVALVVTLSVVASKKRKGKGNA